MRKKIELDLLMRSFIKDVLVTNNTSNTIFGNIGTNGLKMRVTFPDDTKDRLLLSNEYFTYKNIIASCKVWKHTWYYINEYPIVMGIIDKFLYKSEDTFYEDL